MNKQIEGHHKITETLVKHGAIPDALDKQGDTAESWALEWENYKCAMILGEATKKRKEKLKKEAEEERFVG